MAIHNISASTSAYGSPIGTGVVYIQVIKAPSVSKDISIASTSRVIADGSGPSGPVRPISGLVYPVYL